MGVNENTIGKVISADNFTNNGDIHIISNDLGHIKIS
jgi:hypothetical protein